MAHAQEAPPRSGSPLIEAASWLLSKVDGESEPQTTTMRKLSSGGSGGDHDAAARRTINGIAAMICQALGASSTWHWQPEQAGTACAMVPLAWLKQIEAGVRLLEATARREHELKAQLAQLRARSDAADEENARRQAQLRALEDELGFAEAREASLCERLEQKAEGGGGAEVVVVHEGEEDREDVDEEDEDEEDEGDDAEGGVAASAAAPACSSSYGYDACSSSHGYEAYEPFSPSSPFSPGSPGSDEEAPVAVEAGLLAVNGGAAGDSAGGATGGSKAHVTAQATWHGGRRWWRRLTGQATPGASSSSCSSSFSDVGAAAPDAPGSPGSPGARVTAYVLVPELSASEAMRLCAELTRTDGSLCIALPPGPWAGRLLAEDLCDAQMRKIIAHAACHGLETARLEQHGVSSATPAASCDGAAHGLGQTPPPPPPLSVRALPSPQPFDSAAVARASSRPSSPFTAISAADAPADAAEPPAEHEPAYASGKDAALALFGMLGAARPLDEPAV